MNEKDQSRAERDVIATTDSYGGPVSDAELAEVYLAPKDAAGDAGQAPADADSDPAKTGDADSDWTDEGGATAQGPATDSASKSD